MIKYMINYNTQKPQLWSPTISTNMPGNHKTEAEMAPVQINIHFKVTCMKNERSVLIL